MPWILAFPLSALLLSAAASLPPAAVAQAAGEPVATSPSSESLSAAGSSSGETSEPPGRAPLAFLPPRVVSMGQPPRVRLHWGPNAGYDWREKSRMTRISLAVSGEPRIPQFGLIQTSMLGFAGERGGAPDYGVAAYLKIPWLQAGIEYDLADADVYATLATEMALRRGGLLRRGDLLRIDYRPWKRELTVGLTLIEPLGRYRRTRPLTTWVSLREGKMPRGGRPEGPATESGSLGDPSRDDRELARPSARTDKSVKLPEDLEQSLKRVGEHMRWMDRLLTPQFEGGHEFARSAAPYRKQISEHGRTFAREDSAYHAELEGAFALAAGDAVAGRELARRAEAVLLECVLIPFNRLFAQIRRPRGLGGYAQAALDEFARGLPPEDASSSHQFCLEAFRRILEDADNVAHASGRRWDQQFAFVFPESRLVWLPLNYGLRAEQIDSQEEWQQLVEKLTPGQASDGNSIEYLVNEQFHLRLKRMLRATRTYQVLHIHDLRGRYAGGLTDRIGWDLVSDGYLRAFTEAVLALDRNERTSLPQFFLFLDENYYAENRSREIVSFLEELSTARVPDLRDGATRARVIAAQQGLRAAIDSSPALRLLAEAERRSCFKVHVSITHPFDPSFGEDSPLRDHRKLAYRDVFEDDPASGEGIATGQGVGEHYNGTGWDDRSVLLHGPVLAAFKAGARDLLFSQGYGERELPACLRARPRTDDYRERCAGLRARGWTASASAVMNMVGYGDKAASALKAALYNLVPAGGTILTFDSLWISDYWAGMLIAAALRGVNVYAVAPTPANAPSSALPTMVLLRENMSRLMEASQWLAPEIAAAGGSLNVGLYDTEIPVTDLRGRLEQVLARWEGEPCLASRFGLDPAVFDSLRVVLQAWPQEGGDRGETAETAGVDAFETGVPAARREDIIPIRQDHKPFLHMKTQFLAAADAMEAVRRPEWARVMAEHLRIRIRQTAGLDGPGICEGSLQGLMSARSEAGEGPMAAGAPRQGPPRPPAPLRGAACLLIGSQNQDRRGMMLDGEVTVSVYGPDCFLAVPDLLVLLGNVTWPADRHEFARTFPELKGPGLLKRAFLYIKDQI